MSSASPFSSAALLEKIRRGLPLALAAGVSMLPWWPADAGAADPEGTPGVPNLVINEIHYTEDNPTIHSEFIELYNAGATAIDLSGWYFDDGISYAFPAGTIVAPGGYLVVCEDPATLQSKWGVSGAG